MKSRRSYLEILAKATWDYLRGRHNCTQPPFRFWLEPTNICNIKCEMCPNPFIPKDQLGLMEFTLFKKIIDEASTFANEVYIFHRGESLIHPELHRMISYAKENGLLVKLNTNATILSEKKSREILESGLDLISFSVDGYEKGVFEKIRVGAHFERVVDNVRTFLQLKKDGGYKRPLTQIEIMEFLSYSGTDVRKKRISFFSKFKGLKFDRTIFRKPHNVGGNVVLTEAQGYRVRKKRYSPCSFPWYSLAIHWNGNVCPCPRDFMGDLVIGNLRDRSLVEIWNGEKMLNVRKNILNRYFDDQPCCKNCDQVYKYQTNIAGIPVGYFPALFKDSPLVYGLRRFLNLA
jgi:radical SAM protein with 4Fe4S-binding SPASM domain